MPSDAYRRASIIPGGECDPPCLAKTEKLSITVNLAQEKRSKDSQTVLSSNARGGVPKGQCCQCGRSEQAASEEGKRRDEPAGYPWW